MKTLVEYREELKKRVAILLIFIVLALLVVSMGNTILRDRLEANSDMFSVLMGFATGFELVCLFYMGKLWKPLKDEEVLRKLYVKEHDERELTIRAKAGIAIISMLSLFLFLIALTAGFFNKTVFYTLTLVALGQDLIALLLQWYWRRKL